MAGGKQQEAAACNGSGLMRLQETEWCNGEASMLMKKPGKAVEVRQAAVLCHASLHERVKYRELGIAVLLLPLLLGTAEASHNLAARLHFSSTQKRCNSSR
jgi:hypothetical protein